VAGAGQQLLRRQSAGDVSHAAHDDCQYCQLNNKSSAVAEMGDRLATIDMGQKVEAAVPLSMGELGPHLTQCCLGQGLPPYQVAS